MPVTNKEASSVSQEAPLSQEAAENYIVIQLNDTEAQEFSDFDLTVEPEDTWDPPGSMITFLEKHFNRCLSSVEREAILGDFPKPNCAVLEAPI